VLGGELGVIESGSVSAIISSVEQASVRAKRRDLLTHSEVLQRAFTRGPVLPFRFGTVFPSASALVDELLAPRERELASLLDRFDGLGELRLRAAYHDQAAILAEIVGDNPAIGRLRGRGDDASLFRLGEAVATAYATRREADGEAIVARLAEHSTEVTADEPASELEIVRASFLVPQGETAKFDAALDSVALANRHLIDFTCTGPVPPHSFVNLGGA
jgi:hypothetical protein